ncbi:MAG: glycoside hydrolase family 140 protein [Roseburia sp.]|nr:glycoside hydrolase family 140 protein [Anaeroplasma bactoclasticum]MCM1196881.1 glycoside hydrolase family 140 protein [Roseburia sp.]MCM1556970.1 glycoside hydrolase family 140 protein [Anaeroplasma bactoclasticum]
MKLEVKERYLFKDDNFFFWLGDTAWLLFEKLSFDEAKQYLDQRKSIGFNVIQCVLIHTYKDGYSCAGKSPLSKSYWQEVKEIVSYAESIGMIMGILPMWGKMVKNNILNEENIDRYTEFLVKTFKNSKNIVWILGGDIRADEYLSFYNHFGNKLKELNSNRLITFHPFGRTGSYQWFKDSSWIDFHMFQSGHRRYDQVKLNTWDDKSNQDDVFGEDNYKYVRKSQSLTSKPCLDGEPSYEGILQGLHDMKEPYWQDYDIRRYAYWSVLSGTCGFTYGNNAIMQFHRKGDNGSYGVREEWMEALNMPGGKQMQYLKELILSLDITQGSACPEMVVDPKPFYEHIAVFASKAFVLCYDYLGREFSLNLKKYKEKELYGFWINPKDGTRYPFGKIEAKEIIAFMPQRRKESNDWILLLVEDNEKFNLM